MALVTATLWQQYTGQTVTGAELTALGLWCSAVDAAVKGYLRPYYPEPETVTLYLEALPQPDLFIPAVPVRSITAVYLNAQAYGVDARFTPDTLLTDGEDYVLARDDGLTSWGLAGVLRRLGGRPWGMEWQRTKPLQLAPSIRPVPGAVKVIAQVGADPTPADIVSAAVQMVTLLFRRRVTGYPTSNESWNGYSIAQVVSVPEALRNPDVLSALDRYKVAMIV